MADDPKPPAGAEPAKKPRRAPAPRPPGKILGMTVRSRGPWARAMLLPGAEVVDLDGSLRVVGRACVVELPADAFEQELEAELGE